MRRRALQIVVLLVLLGGGGAIVNVAVAWGIAGFAQLDSAPPFKGQVAIRDPFWWRHVQISRGLVVIHARAWGGPAFSKRTTPELPTWSATTTPPNLDDVYPNGTQIKEIAAGWPLLTLYANSSRHYNAAWQSNNGTRADWGSQRRTFPFEPLWPGFAINTIFYAAMLWVVFFVPGMVRRRIRRRRGLCPACAYPIGTSEVCTECGAALTIQT